MPTNRQVLFAISSISFALIAVALYLQHAMEMRPCPLCVIQRYMFLAIGVCTLVGAIGGKVRAATILARSEERRVGEECRSRWWPYH